MGGPAPVGSLDQGLVSSPSPLALERPEVCVRPSPAEWWECVPRSATAARELEGKEASGDVGTVHDSLLFGGT